jgi:hypothetical protein
MDFSAQILAHSDKLDAFAQRDRTADLGSAVRKAPRRGTAARARRITDTAMILVLLLAGMLVAALFVETIGITGIFIVLAAMLAAILAIGFLPRAAARPVPAYREDMPNDAVVKRLATLLGRHRAGLPPAAGQRVDAMFRQLPLLEKQLAALDPIDPLAQDARRLVGQHIPELIDRYERVPPQYRSERDGEGMSMDDRLVSGLDAARVALEDLERRLSRQDMDGLQTQSRFLESRYKDDLGTGA